MSVSHLPPSKAHPRSVTILGATGSVGCSTLDLIEREPDCYRIVALTANRNVEGLAAAAKRVGATRAVIADPSCYTALKDALAGTEIEATAGAEAVEDAAAMPADWVMAGIVGAAGLRPTLAAVRRGAMVAFANKECLVCAGDLFMQEVADHNAVLLPVDSEHNAIFQVFNDPDGKGVEKIILTASGGPFRTLSLDEMAGKGPAQAVAHPNWDMGAKISVDSATMMNKGLELIEAFHLFPVAEDKVEILVHPQSVIHSMVAYKDGSVLAQLGTPDMRTPIAYALGWPSRIATPGPRLDLAQVAQLSFEQPDEIRFPALRLARAALRAGGLVPTWMNAANEIAVARFLAGDIGFLDIARLVEAIADQAPQGPLTGLEQVFAADEEARAKASEWTQ